MPNSKHLRKMHPQLSQDLIEPNAWRVVYFLHNSYSSVRSLVTLVTSRQFK